jgi:hypothetical protein
LHYEGAYNAESLPANPDFDKKIQFNGLSFHIGSFLQFARLQNHAVRQYFEFNSNFTRNELREKFNGLYKDGLNQISSSNNVNVNDEVFFYILNKASPVNKKAVKDAVIVLMAYYFEYCDIFESPGQEIGEQSSWPL